MEDIIMSGMDFISDVRVATAISGILIIYILYWYSKRNHDYWAKRGVPSGKMYPFIGSLGDFFSGKRIEDIELERYKLGRIYGTLEGSKPVITVSEPELIRNILVKDFQYFMNRRMISTGDDMFDKMVSNMRGEDWKRVRSIMSPTFSTGKIKRLMSIFQDCAKTVLRNVDTSIAKGPVDMKKIYGAFTMDVIASAAFSTKIDSHNDPENNFVKKAKNTFPQEMKLKFLLVFLMPRLFKMLKISPFDADSMAFFKNVTLQIIEERKRTGQTRNDFLQLLLDTTKELSKNEKWEENSEDLVNNYGNDAADHQIFKSAPSSKNLSINELVAQCVSFFIAGYHNTTNILSLATYLLAVNPETQDKLYKELKDVLKETDGKLTYESLQTMKYLDNTISETFRMFTSGIRLERQAEVDYKLGDTGITIPKGMVVGIPMFAMHRDPEFFPDPEKFNPDRFSPEGKEKQIPYTYMPFGVGPRNCVAMRFVLVELKICLMHVFSTYHVQRCSLTKVPPVFTDKLGLFTPASIIVNLEPRNDSPLN